MTVTRHPGSVVNLAKIPERHPTQFHAAEFWEELGRVVATFGYLENTLARAIFALTGTREYPDDEIEDALAKWLPTLKSALSDALGNLVKSFKSAVANHQDANVLGLDELISDLREAARLRNVLCHGFWGVPDASGKSLPFFVDKKGEIFETAVDLEFLRQVQRQTALLAGVVISTVTHMGWQFPGSGGPGRKV